MWGHHNLAMRTVRIKKRTGNDPGNTGPIIDQEVEVLATIAINEDLIRVQKALIEKSLILIPR